MKVYTLKFGALADPIVVQLEAYGLTLDCTVMQRIEFQKCADALTLAHTHLLLTHREVERARLRLHKQIQKHVCEKRAIAA